jgi:superfamily II DNA or RNA helicase
MAIVLRDYQETFKSDIYSAFDRVQSVVAVLATGGGKTVCGTSILLDQHSQGVKPIVVVHRKELIAQWEITLQNVGLKTTVMQGKKFVNYSADALICSIDTLRSRLEQVKKFKPGFVLYDEAHHITAATWETSVKFFKGLDCKILGLTATPVRPKGQGFDHIFDEMVRGVTMKELVEKGSLARYRIFSKRLIDIEGLHTRNGEYKPDEAAERADKPKIIADAVATWRDKALGLKTAVFAVNPEHSKHIVETYNELGRSYYGKEIAAHIDGKMSEKERAEIIYRFSLPEDDPRSIYILSNFNIVSEGFDLGAIAQSMGISNPPTIDCVQILRPSLSFVFDRQSKGRALRPSKKTPVKIILDHAGNCLEFGDLLDEPDYRLTGTASTKHSAMSCPNCDVYIGLPLPHDPYACVECGYVISHKREKETLGTRNGMVLVDDSQELVEIDFSAAEQLSKVEKLKQELSQGKNRTTTTNKFLRSKPSYAEIEEVRLILGHKPGWTMYKFQENLQRRSS